VSGEKDPREFADWSTYRITMFQKALAQGMTPAEAHKFADSQVELQRHAKAVIEEERQKARKK